MALLDTKRETERFMELLESGFYDIDDRARNSAPPYYPEKEERDKEAVREFVNSDAFDIIREIGGMPSKPHEQNF